MVRVARGVGREVSVMGGAVVVGVGRVAVAMEIALRG
jgi:hypothetical protein